MMKQIPEREDKLSQLKSIHEKKLMKVIKSINEENIKDPNSILYEFHKSASEYFNEFERTLDEYTLDGIEISEDIINRKVEDTINVIEAIIFHWKTIRMFCEKFDIETITPSLTAYATIQRVVKKFNPEIVNDIKKMFVENGLPTYGFDSKSQHSGWKKKNKIWSALTPILVAFIVVLVGVGFLSRLVNPFLFGIIVISAMLFFALITGIVLRMTGYLSETSYMKLIDTIIEKIPFLRKNINALKTDKE